MDFMLRKFIFVLFVALFFLFTKQIFAQTPSSGAEPFRGGASQQFVAPKQEYYKAEVSKIIKEGSRDIQKYKNFFQFIEVKFLEGPEKGKITTFENGGSLKTLEQKSLKKGDQIVVLKVTQNGKATYSVWDKYRFNYLYFALIGFFTMVLIFSGLKKGFGSILGLIFSILVLLKFIVPQILAGRDPLLISIAGSLAILFTTIFLAHGISRKTTVAVASTFVSLIITGVISYLFVKGFHMSGLGDENNALLQLGRFSINPQGLLLGGIIIGALGVLDDITTTQSAAVFELSKLNERLTITDLIVKGYNIGREHIASLVNTLVLAYAGASLGLFVIFVINPSQTPLWVMLNSEMVAEEIIRTASGSMGLILAVPITTVIAAIFAKKKLLNNLK